MPIKHAFTSAKSDGGDATLVRPSDWNAAHDGFSGSSFPGSPSDGDLYYRTDLDLWFRYRSSGTRWVTADQYRQEFLSRVNITATTGGVWHPAPVSPGSDVWLETFYARVFVASGGTALGASHKWVGVARKNPDAASVTIATINVDSGASNTYRDFTATINALMNNGTTHFTFDLTWTKTGSPGALTVAHYLTYRFVAT